MAKILIVDDSRFMRIMIKKMFENVGHQVIGEAVNGQEGIDMYFRLRPDLVSMDISMPGLNGIDAIKEIRLKDSEAKIIVCSAMGQQSIVLESIQYGVMDFIIKPIQPEKFKDIINKALE